MLVTLVPLALGGGGCSAALREDDPTEVSTSMNGGPTGVMHMVGSRSSTSGRILTNAAPAGSHLHYYGGRVVSNVQVVQVVYGSGTYLPEVTSTATPSIPTFYRGVTNSALFDWLTEYNTADGGPHGNQPIGRGSFVGQFQITPASANNGSTIFDGNIQSELARQINLGAIPAPANDGQGNNVTYYAVFFPHGKTIVSPQGDVSCSEFCAYHGTIANINGHEVYYGVHPDMQTGSGCESGCGGDGTAFARYQTVASHELVETVTDPEVGLATSLAAPLAWYDGQPFHGEIGDLCNGQQGTITGGDGQTYTVQTEFSNVANDCIVTRPPRGPAPLYRYFNGTLHFYTAFFGELGNGGAGYSLQGTAGYVYLDPAPGAIPFYRYVSLNFGGHFYTTHFGELGYGRDGWKFESIAGFLPTTSGPNIANFYRYVNVQNGDHYYTTNFSELGNGTGSYLSEGVDGLIFTSP